MKEDKEPAPETLKSITEQNDNKTYDKTEENYVTLENTEAERSGENLIPQQAE